MDIQNDSVGLLTEKIMLRLRDHCSFDEVSKYNRAWEAVYSELEGFNAAVERDRKITAAIHEGLK